MKFALQMLIAVLFALALIGGAWFVAVWLGH